MALQSQHPTKRSTTIFKFWKLCSVQVSSKGPVSISCPGAPASLSAALHLLSYNVSQPGSLNSLFVPVHVPVTARAARYCVCSSFCVRVKRNNSCIKRNKIRIQRLKCGDFHKNIWCYGLIQVPYSDDALPSNS